MLINNMETFVEYIPTIEGFNPDATASDLGAIKPFLEESEQKIKNEMLGADLFDKIAELPDNPVCDALKRVVAINAYYLCIPFTDLIQTPNGFAVVSSGNNIAPASKERVERLLSWVKLRLSESTDSLINFLLSGAENEFREAWEKSVHFERYTSSLFITAGDLQRFGRGNATRTTLDDLYPMFMAYQDDMSTIVSSEYLKELIDNRRNDKLTEYDGPILYRLQIALGLYLKDSANQARELLGTTVNLMIADPEHYKTYMDSQAYKIKTSANYVNKKEDQTFMFNP